MGFFSTFAEVRRLKKALDKAEYKLEQSEAKRDREREASYRLQLNMLDRFFTNQVKTHAVSMDVVESLDPVKIPAPPDPFAGWTDEEREYDIKCFRDAGHPTPEKAAEDAYIQNYLT